MDRFIEKSYLGSLLLSLYYTGNITKGNIEKYNKKLGKEEHTLQEIIDYIENDKHTKLDLSSLVLVSHKDGEYAPLFTGWINYNNEKIILPINPEKGYDGILEHLDEDGVEIRTFSKAVEVKND